MRFIRFVLLLTALPVVAPAVSVHYIDPFGSTATSCSSATCDVIGDKLWFDLDSFAMSVDQVSLNGVITISLNFGPDATLAPFLDFGIRLDPADVIFAKNGVARYGIALTSHNGVAAGSLYAINTSAGVLTAGEVLNLGSGYTYRPDAPVWLNNDGSGSVSSLTSGNVSSTIAGDGVTTGRMLVTITFLATPDFFNELNGASFSAQFASATCGNDVMSLMFGTPDVANPEPGTVGLAALGFVLLFTKGYRSRRR